MDEADWLLSENPADMLRLVTENPDHAHINCISQRKQRLWVEACRALLGERGRIPTIWHDLEKFPEEIPECLETWSGSEYYTQHLPLSERAALLRCITGNPFRPVTLPTEHHPRCDAMPQTAERAYASCSCPCPWLTWSDGAVGKIASAIYEGRRWEEMPILADALADAGCQDEAILQHCRGMELCPRCEGHVVVPPDRCPCGTGWVPFRGPHVRGDWVLDLLLGKS